MSLRIATYNIHRCIGCDGIENPERTAAVLQEIDADIVALQEVASRHDEPGTVPVCLAEASRARAIEGFTLREETGHYGNALLTRLAVSRMRRTDISVPGREPRGVLEVTVQAQHGTAVFLATHLGLAPGERRQQTLRILSLLETAAADVIVLLGDFNEWFLWGRPLRWLKQWFVTVMAPATFPARFPLLRLDRIWVRPAARLHALHVHATPLSRVASDHLPLVAELDV